MTEFCSACCNDERWVNARCCGGDALEKSIGKSCLAGGDEKRAADGLENCCRISFLWA